MEEFIAKNKEYEMEFNILNKIKNKTLINTNFNLNNHLRILKIEDAKFLINNQLTGINEIKKAFKKTIKNESKGLEKKIFKLLLGNKLKTINFETKLKICTEFPEFSSLITVKAENPIQELKNCLFEAVYFNKCTNNSIESIILKMDSKDKLFYSLFFKDHLSKTFVKNLVEYLNNSLPIKDKFFALLLLPEEEMYSIIATTFINEKPNIKIQILKYSENIIQFEKLLFYILTEYLNRSKSIKENFIEFVKLLEIIEIETNSKIQFLFCWLRHFLIKNQIALHKYLLNELKEKKIKNEEIKIHKKFDKFFKRLISLKELNDHIDNFKDQNPYSSIKFNEILDNIKLKSLKY